MGSTLKLVTSKSNLSHSSLNNRNSPYQHELSSIYRQRDRKTLSEILNELQSKSVSVVSDVVTIDNEDSNVVTFSNFVYNVTMDKLLVFYDGVFLIDGPENDYVKDTENSIKLNFKPTKGSVVYIILGGTISNESFGDSIYNGLSRFTQLADTIDSYRGNENKVLAVNQSGTGIVAVNVKASHDLNDLSFSLECKERVSCLINVPNTCYITGIKCTPDVANLDFRVKILTSESEYVYDSGEVSNILWDIMKIPVVIEDNSLKVIVENRSSASILKFHIYYEL